MKKIKISAVSYLNTFPFVYGLVKSDFRERFSLHLDVPSVCAEKLKNGEADIALVPVGALPFIGHYRIVSGYCIGAVRDVKTVLLLTQVPVEQVTSICLDSDSRTSVELVKVLAAHHWKIDPVYRKLHPGEINSLDPNEPVVAIGDKTFRMRQHYRHAYDLAAEWIRFTNLPFVFAIWVARNPIDKDVEAALNSALSFGVNHIPDCLVYFKDKLPGCDDCQAYLEENISYDFDEMKKEGLTRFLELIK